MGFNAINNEDNMSVLDIFKKTNATHQEIQAAGEWLLLKRYSAAPKIQTLDHLRFVKFQGQIKGKSLTARIDFDLRTLSPTSDATKYHIYRTYYKVQKYLSIHVMEYQTEAPKVVLMMISFGSKQGCNRKLAGIMCTIFSCAMAVTAKTAQTVRSMRHISLSKWT